MGDGARPSGKGVACSQRPWPLIPATAFGFMPGHALSIRTHTCLTLCWKQNGPPAKVWIAGGQLSSNKDCGGMFKETLATGTCHSLRIHAWPCPQHQYTHLSDTMLETERPSGKGVDCRRAAELQQELWRHVQRDPGH